MRNASLLFHLQPFFCLLLPFSLRVREWKGHQCSLVSHVPALVPLLQSRGERRRCMRGAPFFPFSALVSSSPAVRKKDVFKPRSALHWRPPSLLSSGKRSFLTLLSGTHSSQKGCFFRTFFWGSCILVAIVKHLSVKHTRGVARNLSRGKI